MSKKFSCKVVIFLQAHTFEGTGTMLNTIAKRFTSHPATVDETYAEHARFAARFSGKLLLAGGAALVHAVLPFCFEKTAGNMIRELHGEIANRG